MKKSVKAVLLSAFVFPGVGHFTLKKPISGTIFCSLAFIAVYLLFSQVLTASQLIVEKIQSGEVSADIATITELVHQQLSGSSGQSMSNALIMFLVVWLVSTADSYRIGRVQE